MIAALYVAEDGPYVGLDDVDAWGVTRDARTYAGPWPVVAHPPCERWGRYWHGGPSARVRRVKGDDGGCFAAALASVRAWGGVLEHERGAACSSSRGACARAAAERARAVRDARGVPRAAARHREDGWRKGEGSVSRASQTAPHEPRQGGSAGDLALSPTGEQRAAVAGGAARRVTETREVAVLFAYADGAYAGLPGVDVWHEKRDARLYNGSAPVVAHPPCSRWCQLAHVNQKRYGHRVGEDGGCFASALAAVRRCGGVLEHPASSYAWPAFRLPRPRAGGGWSRDIVTGEWVCEVAQVAYKHAARKLTWLLYVGGVVPPELDWSRPAATAQVSWCANHGCSELPRIGKRKASETPAAFRDALLSMARGSRLGAA